MQRGLMIATNFWWCTNWPKEVWTQFHMWWCPDEQIAWRLGVTWPETPTMLQTEWLTSRWINGSIQTLLNLLESCRICPTWYNATSTVCRIHENPATAVKHGAGTGQVNLVTFEA
jgi:hypothetical protein